MKRNILTLLSSLLFILSSAQTQDLYQLANGKYQGFNAIFDQDDNLYGYVAIYSYDASKEKRTKKFEYVILDKNLNPVANKEFEGDITTESYFGFLDFRKNLILSPYVDEYAVKPKEFFYPRSMVVNLKDNTIKTKTYYDYKDGVFTEIPKPKTEKEEEKERKKEKRTNGYIYHSYIYEIKEGGYLISEFDEYKDYVKNNSIIRFDENKKELWRYRYNTNGDKKNQEWIKILDKNDKYIYLFVSETHKKEKKFYLKVLDIKTGKIISDQPVDGQISKIIEYLGRTNRLGKKSFEDKTIYILPNISEDDQHIGYVKATLDKKNFNIDFKPLSFLAFKNSLPNINANGKLEKGYYLLARDFFFLKDGSVGILFEKYKEPEYFSAAKTTDMVYVFTNPDFSVKGVKVLEKEKTVHYVDSDYLFYQYLNQGKDVVFFYRDLQKDKTTREKDWKLFINTLIKGNFKQEVIPISEKDNYFMVPYVAKEGYILLREYNEKEKYNKIRLERLNY
ncbi:hypothetical protein [Riemerella columbina]|uniref:hypothetical protein n=1 Tax=Riemerella columbina TaxID=103810 RepID=UPI00266F9036|nr:hypothetical protein [Riemerella columbina]WKS95284.1 hypothetical protein NYR17_00670 [Riemerella columbina]